VKERDALIQKNKAGPVRWKKIGNVGLARKKERGSLRLYEVRSAEKKALFSHGKRVMTIRGKEGAMMSG